MYSCLAIELNQAKKERSTFSSEKVRNANTKPSTTSVLVNSQKKLLAQSYKCTTYKDNMPLVLVASFPPFFLQPEILGTRDNIVSFVCISILINCKQSKSSFSFSVGSNKKYRLGSISELS